MNDDDQMLEERQIPEEPHPVRRVVSIAASVCFATAIGFYFLAGREVSQLQVWWAELLVYAIVPTAVTFIVLYRSGWHREITGAARTGSVFLLSCAILGSEMVAVVLMFVLAVLFICAGAFGVNAVTGGNH